MTDTWLSNIPNTLKGSLAAYTLVTSVVTVYTWTYAFVRGEAALCLINILGTGYTEILDEEAFTGPP